MSVHASGKPALRVEAQPVLYYNSNILPCCLFPILLQKNPLQTQGRLQVAFLHLFWRGITSTHCGCKSTQAVLWQRYLKAVWISLDFVSLRSGLSADVKEITVRGSPAGTLRRCQVDGSAHPTTLLAEMPLTECACV